MGDPRASLRALMPIQPRSPLRTLACAVHVDEGVFEVHIVGCEAADVADGLRAVRIRPFARLGSAVTAGRVDARTLATLKGRDLELFDAPTALPTGLLAPLAALGRGRIALASHDGHLSAWTREHDVVVALLGAWVRSRVIASATPILCTTPDVEALAEPIPTGTWVELAAVRRRGRLSIAVTRPSGPIAVSAR